MARLKQLIQFTNHRIMKNYSFYIRVFENGKQYVTSFSLNNITQKLDLILSQLGHSVVELRWFNDNIIEAMNSIQEDSILVSYNSLYIYVNGELSKIGSEGESDLFEEVPTQTIVEYINDAISFIEYYQSGAIPNIIPESNKNELVVVPKEYVKEDFWKLETNKA